MDGNSGPQIFDSCVNNTASTFQMALDTVVFQNHCQRDFELLFRKTGNERIVNPREEI